MPPTVIRGKQILDGTVQRADLDVTTVGQAVVAKLIQGTNMALTSTGGDAGTGDVTVSSLGIAWKGAWNVATAYAVNDAVQRKSSGYVCKVANTGSDPAGATSIGQITAGASSTAISGIYATKIIVPQNGTLSSISAWLGSAGINIMLGLYTDSSGSPNSLLANSAAAVSTNGLNTLSIVSGPAVVAGTYWIAIEVQASCNINYNSDPGAWGTPTWVPGSMPSTFPGGGGSGAFAVSLYATFLGANANWDLIAAANATSSDAGNLLSVGSDSLLSLTANAIQPTIWNVRLRSFNAIGNPTFEVDQRNVGQSVVVGNSLVVDRWRVRKSGTMALTAQQGAVGAGSILVPSTNFGITGNFLRITLTTQQTSLGAGDYMDIYQNVEGPQMRELMYDVHSVSILVRTSVAGLKAAVYLKDDTGTRYLGKLVTITTSGAWTLLPLPNLPVWVSGGGWSISPGVAGYDFGICLACGSTYLSPAVDSWQNGNFIGATGQDNFASKPVNSTFDTAFIDHEPGPLCTTPIDCPFTQNYEECQRWYFKSANYANMPGTGTGYVYGFTSGAVAYVRFPGVFPKRMAKVPTVRWWSTDGTLNAIRNDTTGANMTVSSQSEASEASWGTVNLSAATAGASAFRAAVDADTGW